MAQGFIFFLDGAFSSLWHTKAEFTLSFLPHVGEQDVQCIHGLHGRVRRKRYLHVRLRALHVGASKRVDLCRPAI